MASLNQLPTTLTSTGPNSSGPDGGTDRRCGSQGHGIATQLIAQATALQQTVQGLLGRQVAIDGRGLFACYQLRVENTCSEVCCASWLKAGAQGLGLDMDGARRRFASKVSASLH